MKLFSKFLLTIATAFSVTTTNAQTTEDVPVRPVRVPALEDINGSPFLTPEYIPAEVQVTKDIKVNDVPVKFNIYNNVVMVKKNNEEMAINGFELVMFTTTDNSGTKMTVRLKAGYPSVDIHTEKSIYQVLSIGEKVHVIKYLSQKVQDANTLGDYSRKELVTTEQLYLYIPGGNIIQVKKGKQAFIDALPAMTDKIEEICTANKLKFKKEADMITLADELNKL